MKREVRVEEILERSGKKATIRVSGRVFRPSGGGQPGDSGWLEGEGFRADVRDCAAAGNDLILRIVVKEGEIPLGLEVTATVDEERGRRLSRMHTGEHILSRALENQLPGLYVEKVSVGEKESTVFMTFDGEIGWDDLFRAEETANGVIRADLPVRVERVSRGSEERFKDVKIKWDRITDSDVSVVSIEGYDSIACSGSHVGSTAEVGGLIVTGFKGSAPEWEVRYTLDRQEMLEKHSRVVRVLSREIGCEEEKLPSVMARLQEERREASRKLDKARRYIEIPWEHLSEEPGRVLFFGIENFPLDLASSGAKRKIEEDPGCIVGFVSQEEGGGADFILAAGDQVKVDLRGLLKERKELQAKGGGAPGWVQGRAGNGSLSLWKRALLSLVDK